MAARIEIFRTDRGEYAFRLRAKDGELIATGEAHKTKAKARDSVLAMLKATPGPRSSTSRTPRPSPDAPDRTIRCGPGATSRTQVTRRTS